MRTQSLTQLIFTSPDIHRRRHINQFFPFRTSNSWAIIHSLCVRLWHLCASLRLSMSESLSVLMCPAYRHNNNIVHLAKWIYFGIKHSGIPFHRLPRFAGPRIPILVGRMYGFSGQWSGRYSPKNDLNVWPTPNCHRKYVQSGKHQMCPLPLNFFTNWSHFRNVSGIWCI